MSKRRNLKVKEFSISDFFGHRRQCFDTIKECQTIGKISVNRVNKVTIGYIIPASWIESFEENFPELKKFSNNGTEQQKESTVEGFKSLPDDSITYTTHGNKILGAILPASMEEELKTFARAYINRGKSQEPAKPSETIKLDNNSDAVAAYANAVYAILQLVQAGRVASLSFNALNGQELVITSDPDKIKKNRKVVGLIVEDEQALDSAIVKAFDKAHDGTVMEIEVETLDGQELRKSVWVLTPRKP
jgi:hypothetical protein